MLRDYQQEAVDSVFREWETVDSTLLVSPTGTGKTQIFVEIINRSQPKRCLVLAHREELIFQAANRIQQMTGLNPQIEMANEKVNSNGFWLSPVIVSSIQTQCSGGDGGGRMGKFDPQAFGILIVDEAHHAPSKSYRRVLEYYKSNPDLKVLGVTATPDRADEKALGQVFDSVAYDYEILDAINDGWLCPVEQIVVEVEGLDFSQVKTTAGDLNGKDLSLIMEQEEMLHELVSPTLELVGDRRTLIFATSVFHAERMCEIINRHRKDSAAWICGKTPKQDRRDVLADFAAGTYQFMVNVGCLCLDDKTEILTDEGWVGIDDMTYDHRVANWEDGRIFFDHPRHIVRRDRKPGERMVSLETKNRSIRVTEDHRMLYRTTPGGSFKIMHAKDMIGKKAQLPINGYADPLPVEPIQEPPPKSSIKRRIQANSYYLRKTHGFSHEESTREAKRRIEIRDSLKFSNPHELTEDECAFIGFWIGDGSKFNLQSGGIEYSLSQSMVYPLIIDWVDSLIGTVGFDCARREREYEGSVPHVRWGIGRGTGFGHQHRHGVYRLEPYLDKNGSDLLWGLNNRQFEALIYGLWMADGDHGSGAKKPKSMRISGVNSKLFDLLQAIAVCRGYRANINRDLTVRKSHHIHLLRLSLSKRDSHAMTKYCLQAEDNWKAERVWCVTSNTGNIITRRRGTVTVTGNTEGFDDPGVEVIVMGRPTKSRALYSQCCGRATRPMPGIVDCHDNAPDRRAAIANSQKPVCTIIDFVGNAGRHRLMSTADILGGKYEDAVIELAALRAREKKSVNMMEALEDAESELEEQERQQKERELARLTEEARRKAVKAQAQYRTSTVDPFNIFHINPVRERGWNEGKKPSEKMINMLEKAGINTTDMTYTEARRLIAEITSRWDKNMCSFKQAKLLKSKGLPTDVSFEVASKMITALKNNGWQPLPPGALALFRGPPMTRNAP